MCGVHMFCTVNVRAYMGETLRILPSWLICCFYNQKLINSFKCDQKNEAIH